jgi:hypothetical protein
LNVWMYGVEVADDYLDYSQPLRPLRASSYGSDSQCTECRSISPRFIVFAAVPVRV